MLYLSVSAVAIVFIVAALPKLAFGFSLRNGKKTKKGAYIYACQLRQIEGSPSYTKAQGSAYNVIKPIVSGIRREPSRECAEKTICK